MRQGDIIHNFWLCVQGELQFLFRKKAEIVQMHDCWHSTFLLFPSPHGLSGSSEEKQLLLFSNLQFPLCTERKENGKNMEKR